MEQILLCRDCDEKLGIKIVDSGEEIIHSDMICSKCSVLQTVSPIEKTISEKLFEQIDERLTAIENRITEIEKRLL